MRKLSPKQNAFVAEYLVDGNGVQAARRAGYKGTDEVLASVAHENLRKPQIAKAVAEAQARRQQRLDLQADDILRELLRLARTDIGQAYDEKGRLKPIHEMPEDVRRAISGVKVFEEFEGTGKDRVQIGEVREVKFWDKVKGLELLGKHLKLFTEKVEHSGTVKIAVVDPYAVKPEGSNG